MPVRPRNLLIVALSIILIVIVLGMSAAGENTPPTVEIKIPKEGASLGMTVTVSGKARDAEGFNIASSVEARWNDWEWFPLPVTPADGNASMVFGEMVYLVLKGELPTPEIGKLMDAILVSSVDHGATPPSALASRTDTLLGSIRVIALFQVRSAMMFPSSSTVPVPPGPLWLRLGGRQRRQPPLRPRSGAGPPYPHGCRAHLRCAY